MHCNKTGILRLILETNKQPTTNKEAQSTTLMFFQVFLIHDERKWKFWKIKLPPKAILLKHHSANVEKWGKKEERCTSQKSCKIWYSLRVLRKLEPDGVDLQERDEKWPKLPKIKSIWDLQNNIWNIKSKCSTYAGGQALSKSTPKSVFLVPL